MPRYQADPAKKAVLEQIMAETARAKEAQRDGQWVTYLIRDPRYPDKKGNPGIPIYIGQTDDFPGRVLSRFMKCEKEALEKGKDCVEKRVADLLKSGVVAGYQVLDYQPTRLASLVSETNYARRAWNAGYDLANRAKLQDRGGDPIGRADIPRSWIDKFTIGQAIADEIEVCVSCSACGETLAIPLDAIELERPATTLGQLAKLLASEPCTFCDVAGERRVRRGVREAPR
jgi:hypothetical protein